MTEADIVAINNVYDSQKITITTYYHSANVRTYIFYVRLEIIIFIKMSYSHRIIIELPYWSERTCVIFHS